LGSGRVGQRADEADACPKNDPIVPSLDKKLVQSTASARSLVRIIQQLVRVRDSEQSTLDRGLRSTDQQPLAPDGAP
jgi:hypothetical protein